MRFVKPKKGFRLSKKLGLLLFSTAVISGTLSSNNKAYGLEAPSMPPSVLMASAKNAETSANKIVKSSEKKDVKVEKAVSAAKETKSESNLNTTKNTPKIDTEKSLKEVVEPAPIVKQNPVEDKSEELTPAAPPSVLVSSVKNLENKIDEDDDDEADDDFSIKGEEPKPSSNLIASAKIVEKDASSVSPKLVKEPAPIEKKAEVKPPVEKKESSKQIKAVEAPVKKADVKPAEKPVSNVSAKNDIVKTAPKTSDKPVEVKKAEKAEVKEEVKSEVKPEVKKPSKVRRVSKKVVVEDNECPPEWDWFSKPLIFVRDANGKLVITADKNAPNIVIGSKKTSDDGVKVVKPVKAEKKVVIAKKNVVKPAKKAEPQKEYVEAKPFEAPAAPVAAIEPKPVVEEKTAEVKVEETNVVSYERPVVMIKAEKPAGKRLFAEAAEKMARIKRLHSYDTNTVKVASAKRSASMVRMNKLVVEMIKRADNKPNKENRLMKASLAPQAPPESKSSNKIAEKSTDNNNSESNNNVKYAFRPYVNPNYRGY